MAGGVPLGADRPNQTVRLKAGMPAFNLTVWFGLSAPKGTPPAIVDKLNRALGAALDDPDVVKRFADLGYDVVPKDKRSAADFDSFYKNEVTLWSRVFGGASDKPN